MRYKCTYRCPRCGVEETIHTNDPSRIVTCGACTDDEGWRIVMKLVEDES